jgi:Arc/MetJ-type ribon-helix-helix transcriptional regulator
MVNRYRNVSIPEELYLRLEKLVKSNKSGYVSVSDAVKDAVRELLRKNQLLP